MTISAGFLIYAALYRLTVLAIGALSIWLGFRLFSQAKSKGTDSSGSASAEGGGFKLSLTNLLPGTYFALFGTVIIGIMLWKGEPELIQRELFTLPDKGNISSEILLRGNCQVNLGSIEQEFDKLKSSMTLTEAAKPLHKIACFYWKENRIGEAVAMAKLAVLYGGDEEKADRLTLLAELLQANGDKEGAAKVVEDIKAMRKQGE